MLTANITNLTVNRENVQTTLLKEVNFELDSNCIYSIVGKNGTGKTTFIKSLTGLLDKRFYTIDGKVIFEGRDLLSLDHEKLRLIHKIK